MSVTLTLSYTEYAADHHLQPFGYNNLSTSSSIPNVFYHSIPIDVILRKLKVYTVAASLVWAHVGLYQASLDRLKE